MRAPIPFRQFGMVAMVRKRQEDDRKEEDRTRKMCVAVGCPRRGQRGWCKGYCKRCAPKNGRNRPVKVGGEKNVKIENDKPKMWTLNAQAEFSEFPEDWGDSEDPVSEGQPPEENVSEQDPPTARAPQGARE